MRVTRVRDDERGAAAVEFALVAMLLVTLLFGILQFGLWFWSWQIGAHAAREGARVAAVCPTSTSTIKLSTKNALSGAPTSDDPTINVSLTSAAVGEEATIKVHFTTANLGFFPGFDGIIDKSATTRIEHVPETPADCEHGDG